MTLRPGRRVCPEQTWALEAWREVLAAIPDPHPFLTPEWQRAWWDHFGQGELSVVPLNDGPETVAVAALHRDPHGVVRFLGGRDLTDYPGPAVAPGRAGVAAARLLGWLLRSGLPWRELDVHNARPQDGLIDQLEAHARSAWLRASRLKDDPVAVLSLPDTWDGYLGGLRRHPRRELRRKRNRLFRAAPGATLRSADEDTVASDLAAFFALHRSAKGEKGAFLSVGIERFFRRIVADFLPSGTLRLDVLEHGDRPLAVTIGFRSARAFYLYNMAFDATAGSLSPGIVLLSLLVERAIVERLERFDFLRGLERYKLELGATPTHLQRLRVTRA